LCIGALATQQILALLLLQLHLAGCSTLHSLLLSILAAPVPPRTRAAMSAVIEIVSNTEV
jgi:hypothetical protein